MTDLLLVKDAVWVAAGLLCLLGLCLSCISISGTWLVVVAAALLAMVSGPRFPGWGTPVGFAVLSAVVEGIEAGAGYWGVVKRGGSGWTGLAALFGGAVGLFAGTLIPIPFLGNLIGMLGGSFLLAYFVELRRVGQKKALSIAKGALTVRLLVMLLKVITTLGMIGFLAAGLWLAP